MSVIRSTSSSAKSELLDLHFEVRNAIAEMLASPTSAHRVTLQRAIHRFLAAERTFANLGEGVISQLDVERRRAELLRGLQALDAQPDLTGLFGAVESLRHTFLELCYPLWRWREDRADPSPN